MFDITIKEEEGKDKHLTIEINKKQKRYEWALKTSGSYILRTNWKISDPIIRGKCRDWGLGTSYPLDPIEDAFRITKSDLGMRPIYHQKKERTKDAHTCVLSCPCHVADTYSSG